MTLLCVVAGTLYVLIGDRTAVKQAPAKVVQVSSEPSAIKPVQPAPNAAEGASIESVTSPVAAGSNVSLAARTNPHSTCTISVSYNGVASTDSGLVSKPSDPYGGVTWTWTVGSSVPAGNWPIKVTCVYNGRSAVVDGSVQVTK